MGWYGTSPQIPPREWRNYYVDRGERLTGLTRPAVFYEPLWLHSVFWTENNSNGDVTVEASAGYRGGVAKFDTTATVSSRASLRAPSNAWVNVPTTEAWYMAAEFQLNTTPSVVTSMALPGMLALGAGQVPRVGVEGATSTTKFVMSPGSGTLVQSSVSIDTSVHVVEFFSNGDGNYYAGWDGESWITGVHGGSTAGPYYPYIQANNNADANTQTYHLFEVLFMAGRS